MNRSYTKQYDKFRCGPVALANVIKWAGFGFNYKKRYKELSKLCKSNPEFGTCHNDFNKAIKKIAKKGKFKVKKVNRPLLKDIERHLKKSGIIVFRYNWSEINGHYFVVDLGFDALVSKGSSKTVFVLCTVNALTSHTYVPYVRKDFKKNFLTKYRDRLMVWFISMEDE